MARWANCYGQLNGRAKETADAVGLGPVVSNPFKSLLVRMIETIYACEEALRIVESYRRPERPSADVTPGAGEGYGCTEAPRGICHHWYRLDDEGRILNADIIPPTSQNQRRIEADVTGVVAANLDLDDDALQWRCEQAVRNYDPCISCSTHFVKLHVDRG
jgi:coenzyme F420-reducing hydrogenase alpha subunit